VLVKRGVWDDVPVGVRRYIEAGGASSGPPETPKPGDPVFHKSHSFLVGTNSTCLDACRLKALEMGFVRVEVLTSVLSGEARDAALELVSAARRASKGPRSGRPACLIAGGETTVTISGIGKGGRNQELALAAALELRSLPGVALFSAGTDGTDGPTDAAGAIAFSDTVARGRAAGIEAAAHLADNDSYHFFEAISDLVVTGPTRTNVMDVQLVLVS